MANSAARSPASQEAPLTVRTRIAPSPTGDPHVGTAYVALFNACFARQHGGQFILRIEDTDRTRSTRESEEKILEALRWVGLTWDEGPDVGGPHGPYRQSERGAIYSEHAQSLLDRGHAFRCFCTPERMAEVRKAQMAAGGTPRYDGHCLSLAPEEAQKRAAAGEAHVVRMKVPAEGICAVRDRLRGTIEIDYSQVDMQVLLKSDGMPTYHLANVVDDHLMGITHVMRGEEWISSAPKHLLLYGYFGWQAPELCHLPLLRNPDRSKLSKRKNPTSILYYRRMGYLPEALLNYLGRMAWSMPDEREKFTLDEMQAHFDLDRVSLGGPIFDVDKLTWLNGRYIREDLDDQQFIARVVEWAVNPEYLGPVIPLVRPRISRWTDLIDMAGFFLQGTVDVAPEALAHKRLPPEEVLRALVYTQWRLDLLPAWNVAAIEEALRSTADAMTLKLRDYLAPLFVAISGRPSATPLFDTLAILGRDVVRARLRVAIEALGGLSGKLEKKWRRAFDEAMGAAEEGE
ncbi:MAG: glutamate--tRNA ligase [Myxococcales bacterium]|nr:glutamate--tRNA ligase [Myxococcales bacterium]